MLNRIISFSIQNKFIIALLTVVLIGFGTYSMRTINLGSVPDITNNQVQVITISPNLSTVDIEQFVSLPVEMAMGNLPGIVEIRSISRFGLSVVTLVFEDNMGIYLPRQLVQEKLMEVRESIPMEFGSPKMGPITTGLGEIYQYTIQPKEGYDSVYSLIELRTIQDWIVARQLTMIEGVVEINAFGGKVKQYEIAISPHKLQSLDVSIGDIYNALKENNINTGGSYIVRNQMANFIRGEGLIRTLDDIRQVVIKNENGIPLTIGDIAEKVHFGSQVRYGAFTQDGKEAVGGMVLMLKDANPSKVIERVKKQIKIVQKSLPEGLEIVPFLERDELISRTTDTVQKNLMEGALIVIFALVFLLGSLRGGIITATTIPLSLLFAFILMKEFGVAANLMSLGAIDFGIIIDGSVIIIERAVFVIQRQMKAGKFDFNQREMDQLSQKSANSMMGSAFFGQIIILIVFAPILFLNGIEGKMFQPMAYTFGFAMIGAILLCLTYVPMMTALFMKPIKNRKNWLAKVELGMERLSSKIIGGIQKLYLPILQKAIQLKSMVIIIAILLFGAALYIFSTLGGEFIPQLDEGDIALQAMVRPGSSLEHSIETSKQIENLLLENFPEVKKVVSRIGVADIPTDPMPMDIGDMIIVLDKNHNNWTSAKNKEELVEKMKHLLNKNLVGVNTVFTQPVELRFNELLTGVKEDVAIKIYGEDLEVLARKAEEIPALIQDIPGVGDVNVEHSSGLPQLTVKYDRKKIAQYGLSIEKLNDYLKIAFAGGQAGIIFEGERRFDLVVRLDEKYRKGIEDLENLYIDLPSGGQIPFKAVAQIKSVSGPMQISRDNTFRRTSVGINCRGRDVESVVKDIQERLDEKLILPAGYSLAYGGEFENLKRAKNRLSFVVPIALLLILVLLYFALKSFSQSLMIYIAIPLAAIGGVFSLWLRDMPFSISAGVGFIVLFGVAVLNGLVLISRFNSLKEEGVSNIIDRITIGTKERIRPIMLTATTDIFGFLPMAFSTSAGAEVQQPLATVVIGGMLTATFLTLIVLPVLYLIIEKNKEKRRNKSLLGGSLSMATITLFCFLCFPTNSIAQRQNLDNLDSINIENAWEKAVVNYPKIKARKLEIKKAKALKKTAWDFGETELYTGKSEFGNGEDGIYTPLGIQQQNIDIFGIPSKMKLQNEQVELAESALELNIIELKKVVQIAWVESYISQKEYGIYKELDSIFNQLKRAAEIGYEVEENSRLAYLTTINQANQIHIEKENAYSDYIISIQKLNLWLGEDSLYRTNNQVPSTNVLDRLILGKLENHPLLQQYQQALNVADAEVSAKRANYFPKIKAQYAWQEINDQDGYNAYQIGIQIPLIFNSALGEKQAAKIQRQISESRLEEEKLQLNNAYQTAIENYRKWKNSWDFYQKEALPLAIEQRKAALLAFDAGAINYLNFLQTIGEAINIELKANEVLRNYLTTTYQLEYYLQSK